MISDYICDITWWPAIPQVCDGFDEFHGHRQYCVTSLALAKYILIHPMILALIKFESIK